MKVFLSGEIVTKRLRIVPFSERHLTQRYIGWLNDRDLLKYSEQRHKVHTRETCQAYLATFRESDNKFWAIEECLEGHGHIGTMTAYIDSRNDVADIGILLGERGVQGRGYALEAWLGVCAWLFDVQRVRKVSAGTLSVNVRMLRIMELSSMLPDGVRKRHIIWNGVAVDVVHMALFQESFVGKIAVRPAGDVDEIL
jgi:RimJ/RimL family protein N-acetyltransferase